MGSCELERGFAQVRANVARAAERSGRTAQTVTLVAASKTVSAARLQLAIDLGQRVFGENRVQEAKEKWPSLRAVNPGIELHLLGALQSNKARSAVMLFDAIQSVDRKSVALAIAEECQKQGRKPEIFVQVNSGGEPQKSGVLPEETATLVKFCRENCALKVAGLMCIPPAIGDSSRDFELVRAIADDLGLTSLSMGMSGDYECAIEHGATHVRVGSALFGSRPQLHQ